MGNDVVSKKTEERVGNFEIEVVSRVDVITDAGRVSSVKFIIKFDNGTVSDEIIKPLNGPQGLGKLDWYSLHEYVQLYQKLPTAQQRLMNLIRSKLAGTPELTLYRVSRLGFHRINNVPMYYTGGQTAIWPPGAERDRAVFYDPPATSLDIDSELTEREAVSKMVELMTLSPEVGTVIFSYTTANILRDIFTDVVRPPSFMLYVVAISGAKKTEYTKLFTQLYGRRNGTLEPFQLNSSFPATKKLLASAIEPTILVDDLYPASSGQVAQHLEGNFKKLVRLIGNQSSPTVMNGGEATQQPPRCGIIVTGEYELGTGSDAARCLTVKLQSPIDSVKLQSHQDEPLTVPTFYHFFIKWYIVNYDGIRDLLKTWLNEYRATDLGVHDRLQEAHYFLNSSYRLFLQYCVEKGFTTDNTAQVMHQAFLRTVTPLTKAQHERFRQGAEMDYFKHICNLHWNESFRLAKNSKKYNSDKGNYDGFIHNELLCLRGDRLLEKVRETAPSATQHNIRRALLAKAALWTDGNGKNKKVGQERFVGIYLNKLKRN